MEMVSFKEFNVAMRIFICLNAATGPHSANQCATEEVVSPNCLINKSRFLYSKVLNNTHKQKSPKAYMNQNTLNLDHNGREWGKNSVSNVMSEPSLFLLLLLSCYVFSHLFGKVVLWKCLTIGLKMQMIDWTCASTRVCVWGLQSKVHIN